jgi:hypothetical protein
MTLTVADLQVQLATLPSDMPVILAKDAEGNGYSPLADAAPGMYLAETTWSGEHYLTEEQRLAEVDPDDWSEAPAEAVLALFLCPTN